ncbi:translocator protein-like [Pieris rapae]|uniref:translocator protein-like n=1 Tax=Pieris rapae TaxID=64459 RepID=UPI000B929F99|nr:translocator protein-like [Pieris rapae]
MVNWKLIGALALPNVGGWLSALTMAGEVRSPAGKAWYDHLKKPSWNPPKWVFGPAWTVLYTGMGYASYLVYEDCGGFKDDALVPLSLFGTQLLFNWTWSPVFFKYHKIGLAFLHIIALDVAAGACTISFFNVNKKTLYFMAPYLCWLTFASCLNYTIWKLNENVPKIPNKDN